MPWLVPRSGSTETRAFDARLAIGREVVEGLRLDDRMISRTHCIIQQVRDGSWKIHDPGSRNGTWLNGKKLDGIAELKDGDVIGLGSPKEDRAWEFHVEDPAAREQASESRIDSMVQTRLDMQAIKDFAPSEKVDDTEVLRRDYERLRAAWELMQRLGGETRQEPLLRQALETLLDLFDAERGVVVLRDAHGLLRRAANASRASGSAVVSDTLIREVLDNRCAIISRDALTDERFSGSESILMSGIRATMAAPLMHAGEVLGVVILDSSRSLMAFDDQDLEVFETAARQLALSLHNLQLAESVREKEAMRERFERLVTPALAAQIADGSLTVDRQGRERTVSVLFSDIRGFTSMSERMQAADVVELLNTYFEEMVDIVFEHEGTLDKFMGDAVMAIFGAPADQRDHAERAVAAGVKMQQRLAEMLAAEPPALREQIAVGIGINSGPVIAGFLGSPMALEYTVVGDVVNVASRICSHAAARSVMIGETTRTMIGERWRVKDRTSIDAKGKREGVGVFEIDYPRMA
jgi:adenylate cyclase